MPLVGLAAWDMPAFRSEGKDVLSEPKDPPAGSNPSKRCSRPAGRVRFEPSSGSMKPTAPR